MITKKNLKEMKITTYTNKVHIPFRWLNHKNFMIKRTLLNQFYVRGRLKIAKSK